MLLPSRTVSNTGRGSTGPARSRCTFRKTASTCGPRTDRYVSYLKEHYASEEEARFAVEADYIPNWEFVVGLARGPNAFRLRFDRSEIVDRNPPPGPPTLSVSAGAGLPTAKVNLAPPAPPAFPEPPRAAIKRSSDVDSMLSETYRQEVIVPDNVVAFPCKRAA